MEQAPSEGLWIDRNDASLCEKGLRTYRVSALLGVRNSALPSLLLCVSQVKATRGSAVLTWMGQRPDSGGRRS